MKRETFKWALGLGYIVLVACIWIAASFVVQSVEGAGVSPFLVTYICNALFLIYIPLVEAGRYLEDTYGSILFWRRKDSSSSDMDKVELLKEDESIEISNLGNGNENVVSGNVDDGFDWKGRWTRTRVMKASLLVAPFWFVAQLGFNYSLNYTTVTSNTILSSTSSLFTFLIALVFLGEKFTWVKLTSVLLCMGGTIVVSLGDSETGSSEHPALGDTLALLSAAMYAVYVTLIRKQLPVNDGEDGRVSMAQFLGFLGLCNVVIFLPLAIILFFIEMESFLVLTWEELGLIVVKGLFDNVLSDYLWAKAVLLTTTTVASAGLSIQVPLAAIIDSVIGKPPILTDYIGAAAVMLGFGGITIPSDIFSREVQSTVELGCQNPASVDQNETEPVLS